MLRNGYENYMGTKKAIYIALDRYLDEKAIKNLPDLFRHFSIYVDTLPMAINTKDPQFYQEVLSRVK